MKTLSITLTIILLIAYSTFSKPTLDCGESPKPPRKASIKKFCPAVGNQGQHGTCVSWATAYCAQTILWAVANDVKNNKVITENAFSPQFLYRSIKPNDKECSEGSYFEDNLKFLKNSGSVLYKDFHVDCPASIPDEIAQKAAKNKITNYRKVTSAEGISENDLIEIKVQIAAKKPVIVALECPPSLQNSKAKVWIPTESPDNDNSLSAFCIVGYDDDKEGGAFELMNSWGTEFGNKGFIWIKYSDFEKFGKDCFVVS